MARLQLLVNFMKANGLRLATAESCTAGLMASMLAEVQGAGQVLDCAFVTYSPQAKIACLGVDRSIIKRFNLTSEEVAREMVLGALNRSRANVAISNTGVTDSIDPAIPRGMQCFAWAVKRRGARPLVFSETARFTGSRHATRKAAATYALMRLPHYVLLARPSVDIY